MEQHNFENKIKQQFQQREITPSANSWDRLEAKLDANNNKKSNKFWWLGIAAAVAVGIFIGASIFKSENLLVEPQVVENPSEEVFKIENATQIASEETKNLNLDAKASEAGEKVIKNTEKEVFSATKEKIQHKSGIKTDVPEYNGTQVAETENKKAEIFKIKNEDQTLMNESIIAQINNTDAEVEALLASAKEQILVKAANDSVSVAAQDLLREVETDLDHSFKNKVFEMMKDGFYKARTAVADRN